MKDDIAVYKGLVVGGGRSFGKVGTGGEIEVPKYLSSFYYVPGARPNICIYPFINCHF